MKILKLTHTITWKGGGAFFRAFHQGRLLAEKGHDVTIMTISPNRKLRFREFNIGKVKYIESPDLLWGKARTGWDPYDAFRRILYLSNEKFDIVHSYESRPVAIYPTLYFRKKSKIIIDWCDWYGRGGTSTERGKIFGKIMEPIETFFEESFHKYSDGTIVMGSELYKRAISLGIEEKKIINLLHGCDIESIKIYDKKEVRDKLGISQNLKIIGYIGVMRKSTAELLFKAIEILINQGSNYKVYLIGSHKLKNIYTFIPDSIKEYVCETGWISNEELNDYLAITDICVLPFKKLISTNNIWPSKLNDYLSAGKPVLCTELDILKDLFNKYEIGIMVKDNPEEFAKGIEKLLISSKLVYFGDNGRQLAQNELNWHNIADKLEKYYNKIQIL